MENLPTEDISRFDPIIEKFAEIKEKYGDNYPIILYEPSINCQEKKVLKDLIQGNNSIHLFSEFQEAFKFVQHLGISFILIVPSGFEEQHVLKNFQTLGHIHGRTMVGFEEEMLFKEIFQDPSDKTMKSLKIRAFVFITSLDFEIEGPVNKEGEEDVMIMCDLKDMAKEFRQDFVVILYDPKVDSERKRKLEEDIGMKIEENNIFLDSTELYQKINSYTGTPYHLIFSGRNKAEKIIKELQNFKDLLGLYIYDDNSQEISDEKVEIKKTLEELIPKIKEGFRTRSKLVNTFPSFATNFDAVDKSEIYNMHYYLKGLINFHNRKQAKGDFLKLARKIYQDQKKALEKFETGYDQYNAEEIIHWYTKDSPVYKLLNNCLRIASSDSILYSRFVLKEMEEAIREQYQQRWKNFNGVVYRGAYISTEEWEKLERNIGQEIEMYGFLSTTVNQRTAIHFFEGDPQNKILITIIIPPLPEEDEQGFADVSQFSEFKGEREILFNVRSKFRILEANKGTKGRHLALLYGARSLRKYMTKNQPVITMELKLLPGKKCGLCGSTSKLFAFNHGITEVRCIDCLIKSSVPKDAPLFAIDFEDKTEENEVIVKSFKGQLLLFDQAMNLPYYGYRCYQCQKGGKKKYYKWINLKTGEGFEQCSGCFEEKRKAEHHILVAETDPYIIWQESQSEWETIDADYQTELSAKLKDKSHGDVYLDVYRYDLCLEYERKFINKLKRIRGRELQKLNSLQRMGKANAGSSNYEKALEFYSKALGVMKVGFQEKELYSLYSLIACAYRDLGQSPVALVYLRRCWKIAQVAFGENHPETAKLYFVIGMIHQSFGEYQETLKYFKKALNINKAIFGHKHPNTAISYKNLAAAYMNFGQHQKALEYYIKALNIDKAVFGDKHPTTILAYSQCGFVFQNLGQYQKAFEFAKKGLDLKKSIYADKHPFLIQSYSSLGLICRSLQKYQEAFEYVRKALNLSKEINGETHLMTALEYSQCAGAYYDLGQSQEALKFYKKALDIRKALLGDEHQETAFSYCRYAEVLMELGQYQEGLEYSQQAMSICQRTFGEMHPMTATAFKCFMECCEKLGRDK